MFVVKSNGSTSFSSSSIFIALLLTSTGTTALLQTWFAVFIVSSVFMSCFIMNACFFVFVSRFASVLSLSYMNVFRFLLIGLHTFLYNTFISFILLVGIVQSISLDVVSELRVGSIVLSYSGISSPSFFITLIIISSTFPLIIKSAFLS